MKVLIFTDEFGDKLFTFIYNEVIWLNKNNVKVKVICERIVDGYKHGIDIDKIELTQNRFLVSLYLQLSKYKLYFFQAILFKFIRDRIKCVREFNPDIVHFHFGDTAVKFFFQLKNEFKNIPIFITFHGFDASELLNKDWYLKRLKKIVLQPNFYCICVSDNLMKNLLKNGLAVSPAKSFILHYGIDFNRFILEPRIEASAISFLQISTFFEKKGHAYTLEAFSRFKKITGKQVKLILAGDGPLLNDMKNLAEHLQISDDVVFTGWVSRDQARILLQKANYFVHHSITSESGDQEGIPNAIIEAMAMELPVLSTWHSGIPELVENGVNGFLVNERDVEGYALCFEKILSWGYLSRNREKVLNGFSEEKHISDLINIYNFSLRF